MCLFRPVFEGRSSPGAVNSTPAHRLSSSVRPTCSPAGRLRRRRRLETSQRCWDNWTRGDGTKYPTEDGEKTPYSRSQHPGKSEVGRPECAWRWSQKWIPTRLRAAVNLSAVAACSSTAECERVCVCPRLPTSLFSLSFFPSTPLHPFLRRQIYLSVIPLLSSGLLITQHNIITKLLQIISESNYHEVDSFNSPKGAVELKQAASSFQTS